jgi:flavin reductase (DIM6/NTAB) family NADH-FMN oxidoreductase RutF
MEFFSLTPADLPVSELHRHLLGSVSPRPIALASTVDTEGRPNLAPFSFFNVFSANPPILIFSPARRGRDNTTKHTLDNVLAIPEVVVNLVDFSMIQQVSLASCEFAAGVSEFEKAGFTGLPSETIRPLRVGESPVQLECKVLRVDSLGAKGGAGQLVIAEIMRMHIAERVRGEDGSPSPELLDLVARCGGNSYVRASGDALFEIPKPISTVGMGFDALPADILASRFLTGNHLGQLASLPTQPDETEVNEFKLMELADLFIDLEDDSEALEEALHQKAAELLEKGEVESAWMALLSFNLG